MRKPLAIPELTAAEAEVLETLYRTTRDVRLRTRAQMVLLAAEQRLAAPITPARRSCCSSGASAAGRS